MRFQGLVYRAHNPKGALIKAAAHTPPFPRPPPRHSCETGCAKTVSAHFFPLFPRRACPWLEQGRESSEWCARFALLCDAEVARGRGIPAFAGM